MAKIEKFELGQRQRQNVHDEIPAEYHSFDTEGKKYLQIDTMGRTNRDIPGKISQSIQLDKERAIQLKNILESTFGI